MNLFETIKQKISIVEVVSTYVTLKKAGTYWKGRCPFHKENTPSFTVSPSRHIFYCFGCQASGDTVGFVAQMEHYSQFEAAQELIKRYQLPIEQNSLNDPNWQKYAQKQNFFKLNSLICKWSTAILERSPEAQEYLIKRGIDKLTWLNYWVGYWPLGPLGVNNLIKFINQNNFSAEDLIKNGFLYRSPYGLKSAFEERIIFPIKDYLGNICGFGGRIFQKNDKRVKYYNSREQVYFNKGSLLFGLDIAKKSIAQTGYAYLVEGYLDVLALVQNGYTNTVAVLGTACTNEHLALLERYTQKIFVTFDGDAAGVNALNGIVEKCWNLSAEPYVISLPPKEDPASMLAKGLDFKPYFNAAQDIFVFFIKEYAQRNTGTSLGEKLHAIQDLLLLIKKIPDALKQDLLIHKAAESLSISTVHLQEALKKLQPVRQNITQNNPGESFGTIRQNRQNQATTSLEPNIIQLNNKITLLEKSCFLLY